MNTVKMFIAVALLIILQILDADVMAQIKSGTFTVAPHAGWYVFDQDQDIANAPLHGIGLGYNFTPHIGIEGTMSHVNSDATPSDDNRNLYIYRVDAMYHFLSDREFVPYIAAGIGALSLHSEINGTDTNGLINYGAGLKTFITERLTIRADIRHIIDYDDSYNNFACTLGLTYFFGAKDRTEALPAPPMDSDGDGVPDDLDMCPGTPLGVAVDSAGCPVDSDGDGVPDYLDKCPGTPPGLLVDEEGCPVQRKEEVSVELRVEFEFDSSKVRDIYRKQLNEVTRFLKTYPETTAVIEGHTCSIGTEAYNLNLSRRRAESVMQYLTDDGIDPVRMKAVAYGESAPIADNSTEEGRRLNRRVTSVISTIVINVIKK